MPPSDAKAFEEGVAEVFHRAGWRIHRQPRAGELQADLIVETGNKRYIVEVKRSAEGRGDRLIPLLSQAILQAQSHARHYPGRIAPLAIVAARRIPESVAGNLEQFARQNAPTVAIGIIGEDGFRSFTGAGLQALNSAPPSHAIQQVVPVRRQPDLFSDLNQWMLKVLIGQDLPPSLIAVPHRQLRNASQLAEAAGVSVMSASRLINQLIRRGHLDEGAGRLRVVRVDELLEMWALHHRAESKEIPVRWLIKGGPDQLSAALRRYNSRQIHNQPRCCLGLFAAANALGFGFVRGAPTHIYLSRITLDSLRRLGLAVDSDPVAEIVVRVPFNPEAVFRASVDHQGIPVADVLQVWLDASSHPARGRELAREIRSRALKALFTKQR